MQNMARLVRHHATAIVLVACVILSSLPLCWGSLPLVEGHDLTYHLERIESIANGLVRGHVPVWLFANQAYGFGYPAGVCYPGAFLYPFALLRLAGLPLQDAYRAMVLATNAATAAIAHACFRRLFAARRTALVTTVLWVLAPYRLVDVWLRAAVGEYLALTFVPLIAYGLWRICLCDDNGEAARDGRAASPVVPALPAWLPLALGMTGVVQSHVLSVVLLLLPGIPLVVVLLWLGARQHSLRRMLARIGLATLACVILSANVIVPLFGYSLGEHMFATIVADWGIPAERALEPHQLLGLFVPFTGTSTTLEEGTEGDMPTPVGAALLLAFALGVWVLARRRTRRSLSHERRVLLTALLVSSALLAFATTRFFPWGLYQQPGLLGGLIRTVGVIQFPWRFVGPLCFLLVLVAGIVIDAVGTISGGLAGAPVRVSAAAAPSNKAPIAEDAGVPAGAPAGTAMSQGHGWHASPAGVVTVACVVLCLVEVAYDAVTFRLHNGIVTTDDITAIMDHATWSIGFGEYLNVNFDANARDTYDGLLVSDGTVTIGGWSHDDVELAELQVANASDDEATVVVPVLYNRLWQVTGVSASANARVAKDDGDIATLASPHAPTLAEVDGYLAVRVPPSFDGLVQLAFVAPPAWYVAAMMSALAWLAMAVRMLLAWHTCR